MKDVTAEAVAARRSGRKEFALDGAGNMKLCLLRHKIYVVD